MVAKMTKTFLRTLISLKYWNFLLSPVQKKVNAIRISSLDSDYVFFVDVISAKNVFPYGEVKNL